MFKREVDDAVAGCGHAPDARVRVVGREHGDAFGRQRVNHARVFERDRFDGRHEFLMLALGVVHHGDRRRGDFREQRGFARMVHAQFDHRQLMRGVQTEQRERHADLVVEVAGGRQARVLAERGGEDRRDHFLDRGLAVAARDGDERHAELAAPAARERAQRDARVGHAQRGHVPAFRRARDERGRHVARRDVRQEVVRVETLALERDEQIAGAGAAAVGRHAFERDAVVAEHGRAGDQRGGFTQREHAHSPPPRACVARAASARRAWSASEKARFLPLISW